MVYATTKPTPNNGPPKCCFDTHIFKNLPHPTPLGNFVPSLHPPPPPPLTNPGYTTLTGVAIRGYKGPCSPPPPLIGRRDYTIQFSVQKIPPPFPHSVASLPRFGPLLKNPGYASDHIVYVCSLHFPLS